MGEREAFLQAIIEEPEDDAPRLVFADWLEENGDPARAEFIRLQIAEYNITQDRWGPTKHSARIHELLGTHRDCWKRELPSWLHNDYQVFFRRGFAEKVGSTVLRLLKGADELWRAAPVRHLMPRGAKGRVKDLAAWPYLSRLTGLSLWSSHVTDEEMIALTASPHLGALTDLELERNQIGDAGAKAMAACPRLANLYKLDLHFNRVGDEGALALVRSPHLQKVQQLDLFGNQISPQVQEAIKEQLSRRVSLENASRRRLPGEIIPNPRS